MSLEYTFRQLSRKGIVESFPLHTLGYVLFAESIMMMICYIVFGWGDYFQSVSLAISLVVMLFGYFLIRYFYSPQKVTASTGVFTINMLWAVAILYGCVPYLAHDFAFHNAIFESISGFTTTGASIIPNVNDLPPCILVWRAMTGWAGGIGFIIMFCLLLRYFGLDGRNIFVSDGLNVTSARSSKSTMKLSVKFIAVYGMLTAILSVLLIVFENDPVDSICISMSTISTTGFSTLSSDLTEMSMISKVIIGSFLMVSAMNFLSLFSAMMGLKLKPILKDPEIKQMFIWFALSSITLIIILHHSGDISWNIEDLIDTILMVISIGTTTGFVFHDFTWATVAMIFLSMIAMIGGCRESPTGGIKIARLTLVFKSMKNSISTVGFPNEVRAVKFGDLYVSNKICYAALTAILVFLITAMVGTIVITLTGVNVLDSFYLCISSLTTTGTGLYSVADVSSIPNIAKGAMCLLMWLGRMEITLILVLFTPTFWKDAGVPIRSLLHNVKNALRRT